MSDDLVNRNPEEMDKFSEAIRNYHTNMKAQCEEIKLALEEAKPYMQDNSAKALVELGDLMDKILEELPKTSGVSDELDESSKALKSARMIF